MVWRNNERTLTVKGIGNIDIRPDWVVIDIEVEAKDENYEKCVGEAADAVNELAEALLAVGFEETALKTSNWGCEQVFKNINVTKKGFREQETENKRVFDCYKTVHLLKLEYGLGEKELPVVIGAIANCESVPEFDIRFTIKDKAAAANKVLEVATKDALTKAKIITKAAGIGLRNQKTISYNWSESQFFSETSIRPRTSWNSKLIRSLADGLNDEICDIAKSNYVVSYGAIAPEDIKLRDTITFVWEIE